MIGQRLGHYLIIEQLGAGGMGEVYRAEDLRLKRSVAIKVLPPDLNGDPEARARFIQEAQAASALDHPNICTIYQIDETLDGRLYLVMNCYHGQTLKDRITRSRQAGPAPADQPETAVSGPAPVARETPDRAEPAAGQLPTGTVTVRLQAARPITPDEAAGIASQVAEGLAATHQKGIVHRDIKPANIFLTGDGRVKILDFGLAKLAGPSSLTQSGSTMGTIAYMSPEQAAGREVDHRTDIWSLGVVLYEMLTGQLPFRGKFEEALIGAILNDEPSFPAGSGCQISASLQAITCRCLRKQAGERYQTAEEVLADLRRAGSTSVPGGPAKQTMDQPERQVFHFRPVLLAGLLVLALFAATWLLWRWLAFPATPENPSSLPAPVAATPASGPVSPPIWQNSIAVLPFVDLSSRKDQEYFCDGMTEEIISRLSRIRTLKVTSRTSVMRYRNTLKSIKEIGGDLGVENILEGSIRREKDTVRITVKIIRVQDDSPLGSYDFNGRFTGIFDLQNKVARSIVSALQVQFSATVLEAGKSARPSSLEAYENYLKGMSRINNHYLKTLSSRDFDESVQLLKQALIIDSKYALAYFGLAWAHSSRYYARTYNDPVAVDLKLALKYFETAYPLAPDLAETNLGLAYSQYVQKDYDQAFAAYRRAAELNPNDSLVLYMGGFLSSRLGLYRQASLFFNRAREVDPYYAAPYVFDAYVYTETGDFANAAPLYRKSLELSPNILLIWQNFAVCLIARHRLAEAEEMLQRAESLDPHSPDHPYYRSLLLAAKGEKTKALALNQPSEYLYCLLGMKEEALALIQNRFHSGHGYKYLEMLHNPIYASIRGDPRFHEIVNRLKTVHEERLQKYGQLLDDRQP